MKLWILMPILILILLVVGAVFLVARIGIRRMFGAAALVILTVLLFWFWMPTSSDELLRIDHLWSAQSSIAVDAYKRPSIEFPAEVNRRNDSLPDWVKPKPTENDASGVKLVVEQGRPATTPDEAEHSALQVAVVTVRQEFDRAHQGTEEWSLPIDFVNSKAVRKRFTEQMEMTLPDGSDTIMPMYRMYVQVELSPAVIEEIYPLWREQVVRQRLVHYAAWVCGLTLTFVSLATYFRLEGRSSMNRTGLIAATCAVVVPGLIGIRQACETVRQRMIATESQTATVDVGGVSSAARALPRSDPDVDRPAVLNESGFFGIPVSAGNIAIVVDCSTTMLEFNKIRTTREAIVECLRQNAPCRYTISALNSSDSRTRRRGFSTRSDGSEEQLRKMLNDACTGDRSSASSLVQSIEDAVGNEPDVILFVTDARGTRFDDDKRGRIARLAGSRITFSSVQLCDEPIVERDPSLRALAQYTGGEFRYWIATPVSTDSP